MIVYGHRSYQLNLPRFLADYRPRVAAAAAFPHRDAITDLFVDFGEAYAALADALMPVEDDDPPALMPWTRTMRQMANAVCAVHERDLRCAEAIAAHMSTHMSDLQPAADCAGDVDARTHEGFAYFSLYPAQYVDAADRFVAARQPAMLTCIGLRGIGAPLAHVVAAAAARRGVSSEAFTARPRGHPFDRHLQLAGPMRRRLAARCAGFVAVVDEGPGLSGTSFAAGADAAISLGAAPDRVVLFPSWNPSDAVLRSPRGCAVFRNHAAYAAQFDDRVHRRDWLDLSGGAWREIVLGPHTGSWPAVQPQHERRKHLSPDHTQIRRFAGLGRHGRAARDRAEHLASVQCATVPIGFDRGFLVQRWIAGAALPRHPSVPRSLLDTIANYMAFVFVTCRTGRAAIVDDLPEMMNVNANLGVTALDPALLDAPEVEIDGRMLPHEWVSSARGPIKVDALDHHADDFFPGKRDMAWDVAGAIVEFDLPTQAADYLVGRYRRASADRSIGARLAFYRRAYLAYRIGYSSMAAETLGDTPDGRRFRSLRERYCRSLAALEDRRHPHRRC